MELRIYDMRHGNKEIGSLFLKRGKVSAKGSWLVSIFAETPIKQADETFTPEDGKLFLEALERQLNRGSSLRAVMRS